MQSSLNNAIKNNSILCRQTLWKRVQKAVTPLLSQILSVIDRNANLDLLVDQKVDNYVKCLWMHIFHDEKLLPISNSLR